MNANQNIDTDDEMYYLFGEPYSKSFVDTNKVEFDHIKKIILIPQKHIDQVNKDIQNTEKKILFKELHYLHEKYQNNDYFSLHDVVYKTREMSSRYGSCNKQKRRININLKLVHYNKQFLEYVFCHEICHLVVANHQSEFYELLNKIYPNYKQVRRELKKINIR